MSNFIRIWHIPFIFIWFFFINAKQIIVQNFVWALGKISFVFCDPFLQIISYQTFLYYEPQPHIFPRNELKKQTTMRRNAIKVEAFCCTKKRVITNLIFPRAHTKLTNQWLSVLHFFKNHNRVNGKKQYFWIINQQQTSKIQTSVHGQQQICCLHPFILLKPQGINCIFLHVFGRIVTPPPSFYIFLNPSSSSN